MHTFLRIINSLDGDRWLMLLDRMKYLSMVDEPGIRVEAAPEVTQQVITYAISVWAEMELEPRQIDTEDVVAIFRHAERLFFHVRVFKEGRAETFVIVSVIPSNLPDGHILIDLAAEHVLPTFECPGCDYLGPASAELLETQIPKLEADGPTPFAILSRGEGTFLQTYHTEDGYLLEYQLVNTACHYETQELLDAAQVVQAMISYFHNDNRWVKMFEWQKMDLDH